MPVDDCIPQYHDAHVIERTFEESQIDASRDQDCFVLGEKRLILNNNREIFTAKLSIEFK